MAFFSKVGNMLKQSVSKQITSQIPASNPLIYQALRCMSSSKVFVGGLPWAVNDTTLGEAFSQYGQVVEARVVVDRESSRSRGFGFVTFASTEEASGAIQAMDGQDLHGRRVRVNYATERRYGPGGGGYGGGGYGGSGYRGGGGYGGGGYGGNGGYGGGDGSYGGGGYGGGAPSGGQYGGGRESFRDGSDSGGFGATSSSFGGGNVATETSFERSGFVDSNSTGAAANESAVDYDPSEPLEGKLGDDDEPSDYAKRA